jgi:hypothetical protein
MTHHTPGAGTVPAPRGDVASTPRRLARRTRQTPGRAAAPLAAASVGALLVATLVATAPSAAAATPTPDCAAPFPVTEVTSGAPVTGLTVSKGTTPQAFSGEILGVITDGIAPGLDLVVAELTSPAIDAAGGIWQGMSGSPVYAEDGRLIGAVAYGLAYGGSPVAGITPFEDMSRYLGGNSTSATETVKVGSTLASRIAAETDATRSEAAQGLSRLPMPVGIGGIDLDRAVRASAEHGSGRITSDSYRIGRSTGTATAGIDTVVAGGNVAAVLSLGDITTAGVGTVTSVCGDRMVAFGHPLNFSGPSKLGLASATAVYVQEDPIGVPFKVANIGTLGGTITDDRRSGIAGTFGASPSAATVTSKVTYGDATRTGSTAVIDKTLLGDVTLFGTNANHDRVADGWIPGSQVQSWSIEGTHAGEPFTLRYADRYRSTTDIGWDAVFDVADVVRLLSTAPRTTVTSVVHDATTIDDQRTYRITKVEQRVKSAWVDVTGREAKVRSGDRLRLRATLAGSDGTTRTLRHEIPIPRGLGGREGSLVVGGGNQVQDDFAELPSSFESVTAAVRANQRNDEVRWSLEIGEGSSVLRRTRESAPLPRVVGGLRSVQVTVTP